VNDILKVEDFGSMAAENDRHLLDYFVTTPSFDRLFALRSFIAIGRKGTGKTALYQGLEAHRDATTFVSGLKFSDYPWRLHNDTLNVNAAETERYINSWTFLILVELAKLALASEGRRSPEALKALRGFIETNWGRVDFSYKDFYEPKKFMTVKSEIKPQVGGSSLASVNREWVERSRLGESIGSTLSWLEDALVQALDPEAKYFVLFDELDTTFDQNDEAYGPRLKGLLLASKRTASWSDRAGLQTRAVIFLRSDIFNGLEFSDKNKLFEDAAITVSWNDDERGPESLRSLMNERIRRAFALGSTERDPWSVAFDDERMRGTQQKYKYMAARTYLRPRDMIQFANLSLAAAQKRLRSDPGGARKLTNDDIYAAREPYSHYLVREFDDEFAGASTGWKEILEVIRRLHKEVFGRDEFNTEFAKLQNWGQSADDVLESLYMFGLIGFIKRGGRAGGTDIVFRYKSPSVALDPEASQFRVHPGLKEYLGVVEEH
jgi:hypothetical protein